MKAFSIKTLALTIKTLISYSLCFLVSFIFTLICLPFAILPEAIRYENRIYFFLTKTWSRLLIFFSFIDFEVVGLERLPKYPENPSILVMNHTSAFDIPFVEIIVGSYPHIWMSKDSFAKIPLFNILLKRMHILVDKANPRQSMKALFSTVKLAKEKKSHILLFPEGTRYSDGKIHPFLSGFAYLAEKTSRPVIPVAIIGLNKVFSKKSFFIKSSKNKVKLVIGDPFVYLNQESSQDFLKRVSCWFESTLQS